MPFCPPQISRDLGWQYYWVTVETPVSADSVSAISVFRGLLRTENINTFIAKVDHGRIKYLHFNLPASTLVDVKFTCIGFAIIRGFGHPR